MDYNEYNTGDRTTGTFSDAQPAKEEGRMESTNQYIYRADGTTYSTSHIPQEKPKKVKKSHPVIKKVFATIALGILFGVSAACAFMVMNDITGASSTITPASTELSEEYISKIEDDIMKKMPPMAAPALGDSEGAIFAMPEEVPVVTDVTAVVDEVMPSVVSIVNKYTQTGNFFGRTYSQEGEASGSGIIIGETEKELLIATNNHVVENADALSVQFIDGSTAAAFVKGTDEDRDLAVIAVQLESLDEDTKDEISIATLGDSDSLKVGEAAIAIGNALGYGQSVTTGVISAVNRQIEMQDGTFTEGLIQTDAAINPGNSGGALLNTRGEVIGINSNKIGGGAVEGMGYAIPISAATPILEELQTKKTKIAAAEGERGYLGISGRGITSEVASMYGFPEGVYVYEVYENTGAAYAGLQKGDIITRFDGTAINSMEALHNLMGYYEAGETISVTIMRADETGTYKEMEMELTLSSESQMPKD